MAFDILLLGLERQIDRNGEKRWLYRGQCDHRWSTVAKSFRDLPPDHEMARELAARTERTRKVVAALRDRDLRKNESESLAIAQHYSKELDIKTWLVDVTESPWVALFFASDGGKTGEGGVLDYIERTEWQMFSDEGRNLAGSIRFISPFGIPRIKNQAALFIDTPHPEIYRQMSTRKFYFRQTTDVVFEDESLVLPVLRGTIYPQDDPIVVGLPSDFPKGAVTPLSREPSLASISDLTSDTLYAVMQQLLQDVTERQARLVEFAACPLHVELTRRKQRLPHYVVTIHHLRRTIDYIVKVLDEDGSSESVVQELWSFLYAPHLKTADERAAFLESVGQVFPTLLPVAEGLFKND